MVSTQAWAPLMLVAALITSCTQPPEGRRLRDERIGIIENTSYRFEAAEGLLHITHADSGSLDTRATAAEFRAKIRRKRPEVTSVEIRIYNLQDNPSIEINGVDTPGTAVPEHHLGWSWTLNFGPPGPPESDEIELIKLPQPEQDFRFLAMGDIQRAVDRFGDMVDAVNLETEAEFILMLGDITNRSTPEEFDRVQKHFDRINIPIYVTPGNHDVIREDEHQNRFGRANFSLVHRGVRFTSIDSGSAALDPVAWEWTRGWLREGKDQSHVLFSHIPILEPSGIRSGQWNSRRESAKLLGMLREHRLDLMLFGHIHSYYAYRLAGIPTHISGGCGAIEEKFTGINRHYLRVDYQAATRNFEVRVVRIE